MFDLVMFDLDGTLLDTVPEITDAVNEWLATRGLPPQQQAAVAGWIGNGTRELTVRAYAAAAGVPVDAVRPRDDALFAEFFPFYGAHCGRHSAPYPGVVAALEALRGAGVQLAVVTNKGQQHSEVTLRAHVLDRYFGLVVGGDHLAERKPSPMPVRHCLEHFGVAPERSLFVGDSDVDVATARNAGVQVWAVPYGYNQGRPVAVAAPDRVIATIGEIALAVMQG